MGTDGSGAITLAHSPDLDSASLGLHLPVIETQALQLAQLEPPDHPRIVVWTMAWWRDLNGEDRRAALETAADSLTATIVLGDSAESLAFHLEGRGCLASWLPAGGESALPSLVHALVQAIQYGEKAAVSSDRLERRVQEMDKLYEAGIALSAQRDLHALYRLILNTGQDLTGADAGTLYILEKADGDRSLVFSASETDSIQAPYERHILPLTAQSIAGYVALTRQSLRIDDAYTIPDGVDYSFNPVFDRTFGYRTRSILAAPMTNLNGEVVGVVELINRKDRREQILENPEAVSPHVYPFSEEDERLILALASQAAVAVENRMLLETDRLFRELQAYVREVSKVIKAAADVEAGTFEPESLSDVAERQDALGQLARVFQSMAREVHSREQRLRQQVQNLQIEIDHAKAQQEVAQITQTDYFRELQQKAAELREPKGG